MKKNNNNKKIKVFVAMSGGVDSSVAALLLKKQGYDLVGCYIKGWYLASSAGKPQAFYCAWKEDRRDAMRVCAKLSIPFITVNAEKEYKKEVVDYMISEYKAGRTPNPDIMCNKSVKFGVFLKKALAMGADYIATGHYIRLRLKIKNKKSNIKNYELAIAKDKNKDQSYFLWTLTQEQLKYCLFPIGDYIKPEVRRLAKKFNLPNHAKKDSQGVCFIGQLDMKDFLKNYIKSKKGKIILAEKNKLVGTHDGAYYYTIGQRHGLNIRTGQGPYFVVSKDIKKNIVYVADSRRDLDLRSEKTKLEQISWIGDQPKLPIPAQVKIRYRNKSIPAIIFELNTRTKTTWIKFKKPANAMAPGQSAVFYRGQEVLGGGIII